jgi:hypothetical protein
MVSYRYRITDGATSSGSIQSTKFILKTFDSEECATSSIIIKSGHFGRFFVSNQLFS